MSRTFVLIGYGIGRDIDCLLLCLLLIFSGIIGFNFDFLQQDEKATAEVYKEFVASFDDAGKLNKTWVKGGTFNPDKSTSNSQN